jgi:dCTP deaminase
MTFWTAQTIRERQLSPNPVVIDGDDENRIKSSSYELCIGKYVCLTDSSNKNAKEYVLEGDSNSLYITQGQFAIISTEEIVNISHEIMAFISMKASKKMSGLVNVSGFHVDPGFNNHLKFGVFNAGPSDMLVTRGVPFFQIFFANLDAVTTDPYEKNVIEPKIKPEWKDALKGNTLSVSDVNTRVESLEKTKLIMTSVLTVLLGLGALGFLKNVYVSDQRIAKLEQLGEKNDELLLLKKEVQNLKSGLAILTKENKVAFIPVKKIILDKQQPKK